MASAQQLKRPLEEEATPNKKAKSSEIPFNDEYKCTICQEVIYQPTTLDCGHNFCLSCVHQISQDDYRRHKCPNCRETLNKNPSDYQKNLFMEKMMEKLGGEEYQTFCQKRELEKLCERINQKFASSKLCKLIEKSINEELKGLKSISFSLLKEKLEPMFGTKYEFAIISILTSTFINLGDQIIGDGSDQCLKYLREKEDLTNDQLIYLISKFYVFAKQDNLDLRQCLKMIDLYQPQGGEIEPDVVGNKYNQIIEERGKLELYTELEQLIDLYQSDEQDEED